MAEYVKSQYIKRQFGTIDTQRWQELQKMGISPEGMYMLTELLVGRHRNSLGVFYIPFTLATIAKNTGMKEVRVAKVFEELQAQDLLEYDMDNDVVFVKEFWRHNFLANMKYAKGASVRIMELPQNNLFLSMAKLFKQCIDEARGYDKKNPPGTNDKTNEPYSSVESRYKQVFVAIQERIADTPIDTPIDTTVTETLTFPNYLHSPDKVPNAFNPKNGFTDFGEKPPKAPNSIRSKNLWNLGEVQHLFPEELITRAKRFIPFTSKILSPETWKEQIEILVSDGFGEGKEGLEQLDRLMDRYFEKTISKANDKSIVLFNNESVKQNLIYDVGDY